ncbi:hypothetical protein CF65_02032 [Aggregatibacter actinomycetemcomitans HK1651]|nr:hypothetical protein CF65_02032 [Aggregatibacter actinomycetemcomitans HK1651]
MEGFTTIFSIKPPPTCNKCADKFAAAEPFKKRIKNQPHFKTRFPS